MMDETEHEGVRILGASEAAASRGPDRSPTDRSAPPRSVPTPSWDDDDEGWDTEWVATDGDLDLEGESYDSAGAAYLPNAEDPDALWGDEAGHEDLPSDDNSADERSARELSADDLSADELPSDVPVNRRASSAASNDAVVTNLRRGDESSAAPAAATVPVLRFEDDESHDDGRDSWSTFANRGPRWRSGGDDFDDADDEAVAALSSAETRVGTLDPDRGDESDLYSFADEQDHDPDDDGTARPTRPKDGARTSARAGARRPAERSSANSPRPPLRQPTARTSSSLGARVLVGAILVTVIAGVLLTLKTKGGVGLVSIVAVLGVFEFYTSLRQRGFQPAVLLGAAATVLMPIAAYSEGSAGVLITVMLATLSTLLWYLFGIVRDRPAVNMAVTLLGILYVGVLAGTAGLFLANRDGVGILVAAIVGTVAYDIAGFFVGSNLGRRPLAPDISPNKTVEGLIGGMLAAFIVSVILAWKLHPWVGSTKTSVVLGLAIAVMAPLGDLTESMIKRDLGIKDMGSLLPGHGGVLDRVDAMLFTVPAVYCIARWKGWA